MAQQNDPLPDFKHKYELIETELTKLLEAKAECEHCISILGTDEDTIEFRKTMTSHIRNALSLCRSIKSNFNKIKDIHHNDIQSRQLTFISLHSQLKDIVNQIKIKTKQYQPNKTKPKPKPKSKSSSNLINIIKNGSKSNSNVMNNDNQNDDEKHNNANQLTDKDQFNQLQNDFEDMKEVYTDLKNLKNNLDLKQAEDSNIVVKEILFEGFMDKKSRYLKSWRRRWVVLDKNTEDITLFTFKQKQKYLYPTESVIIDDDISIQLNCLTENEFIIFNNNSKAKFVFKALNRQNRKEWIDILQKQQISEQMNPNENNIMQNIQNILIHPNDNKTHNIKDLTANAKVNVDINNIPNGSPMDNEMDNSEYASLKNQLPDSEISEQIQIQIQPEIGDQIVQMDSQEIEPEPAAEQPGQQEPKPAPEPEPGAADAAATVEKQRKLSNMAMYDKSNEEVQECLLLIDDLMHIRNREDVDSENNQFINDFEHSLKHRGFVTKDQIDKFRDVHIKLIGFMFDQDSIFST